MELKQGQRLNLVYKNRKFEAIIINPHAFGHNKPSIGLNFRMSKEYAGITDKQLAKWTRQARNENPDDFHSTDIVEYFELPNNKKRFAVYHLPFDEEYKKLGYSNLTSSYHNVIEVSEFIDMAFELLTLTGKKQIITNTTKEKIKDFLKWFATEGFYAQAYTVIQGVYTKADSEALHQWLEARLRNKHERLPYARFIAEIRQSPAYWTDYTYIKLFGKLASEMRLEWETIDGTPTIARNHIPEALGLEAVGFVERMTTELYTGNLSEAHDISINAAKRKYELPEPEDVNIDRLFESKTRKLNPQQIEEIKNDYGMGVSAKELAERFEVTVPAINYHCKNVERAI
ncbi:MAG: hypothetical protein F6K54_32100 [Okeania sp. SIO3B5]|uniref:hypothetical protein n=1 Tax=Okeania sp. SIO3B5 TaxID=2607811 RepID=UPI00140146E2|nr:hypothetical protein [Okeania sp. SIO3B5]NEO57309.1 hypothetical protein [Okeania sp. SIO3B5]